MVTYRYLVICQPMKAQSISTPGRAKKIIATIWMAAISLSCVIVPFVSGVSIMGTEKSDIETKYKSISI